MRARPAWWRHDGQATTLAVAAIVGMGVLARLLSLNAPMRYDESVSYLFFVGRPWATALTSYQFPNNHLLYTLVAKAAGFLGGDAPWALRLPAFAAGIAVPLLTWLVGCALYGRIAALFGAALTAAATPLILYSANARGYAFVVVAWLGLLLVGERILRQGPSTGRWVAFAVIGGAGLATIPIMLYPLGAAALWIALSVMVAPHPHRRRVLAGLGAACIAAGLIAGAAYLPIIRANGLDALVANRFVAPSSWPEFFMHLLPAAASTLVSWSAPFPAAVAVLLALAALAGIAYDRRVRQGGAPVLLSACIWVAVLLLAGHRVPYARTWLWMLPMVALSVGVAVTMWVRAPWLAPLEPWLPGVAVLVAAGGIAWGVATNALARSLDTGVFAGAKAVANTLAVQARPGDRIQAWIPSNAPLQYYLLRAGADTSLLSTPDSSATREILVLNATYNQTVPWAIAVGMIDTARFGPIAPATHAADANVYVAERRRDRP